jgi:hypothetical protein
VGVLARRTPLWLVGPALLAALVTGAVLLALGHAEPSRPAAHAAVSSSYASLPLAFEPNAGRTDRRVDYIARGPGYTLFLTPRESVLSLDRSVIRTRLLGARARRAVPAERLPGVVSSFVGKRRVSGLPIYGKVRYRGVYPGTDIVYYGNQRRLEYDFVLRPGADPGRIGFEVSGADRIHLDAAGNLVLGRVKHLRPVAYQMRNGVREAVAARFEIVGRRIGFRVDRYDRGRTLVIDPGVAYSTYLGGPNAEYAQAVAVDQSGNTYVTGSTSSTTFPTSHPSQSGNNGGRDAFVTKIAPDGQGLVFSTYLGGNAEDFAYGIAVQPNGDGVYVTGHTFSSDFVKTDGSTFVTGEDAFVTKLSSSGFGSLVYSTVIAGSTPTSGADAFNEGLAIAADSLGNAYAAGLTNTSNFPTTAGAAQTATGGGIDGWVLKLGAGADNQHPSRVYSSYLGGSGDDIANGVALNGSQNAFVVGQTTSANFPGAGTAPGGASDGFLVKMSTDGTARDASRYLGGIFFDAANAVTLDASANVYVGGKSQSFPTTSGSAQETLPSGANSNGFVAKLDSTLASITWATYVGGGTTNETDPSDPGDQAEVLGIALDNNANVYVAGDTKSVDLPTVNAPQPDNAGAPANESATDGFAAKIKADGSAFVYLTYLGGSDDGSLFTGERAQGIATGPGNSASVVGFTFASDFPTASPIQGSINGTGSANGSPDAFVTKLVSAPVSINSGPTGQITSSSAQFTFSASPDVVGETFKCNLDSIAAPSVECTSPKQYTGLAEGTHNFKVQAFDASGMSDGTILTQTFTVDTTSPTAPVPISPADESIISDNSPSFSWSASTDNSLSHYELWVDGAKLAGAALDICSSGTCTTTPMVLAEGQHTWFVRAQDTAGNATDSSTSTFTIDSVPPDVPVLVSPANGAVLPSASPSFEWQASGDAGVGLDHYELWIDGSKDQDVALGTCAGETCSAQPASPLGLGTHNWFIRAVDGAANHTDTATRSIVVDTEPPTAPVLTAPADGAVTTAGFPAFSWEESNDPGSGIDHYELFIDGTKDRDVALGACTAGSCTVPPDSILSEGPHTWKVRAVDEAGNTTDSATRTLTLDSQFPSAPGNAGPADGAVLTTTSPGFSWSESTDPAPGTGIDHYDLVIDGAANHEVAPDACSAGTCSAQPAAPLAQGAHTWSVQAVDGAGNGTGTAPRSFTVDTQPPSAPVLTAPDDNATGAPFSPSFTWSAASDPSPGAGLTRYELWIDGAKNRDVPTSACSGGTCSATPAAPLPEGTHTWQVKAVDGAGHVTASGSRTFTASAPPSAILVIAPNPVLVGKDVTFDGSSSTASGGTITNYSWDLDGDGSFETDTGATPQAVRSYSTPGDRSVQLRVTTVTGQSATTNGVVHISAQQTQPGQFGVSVNNGAQYTNSPDVNVTAVFPDTTTGLLFSNDGGFFAPTQFAPVRDTKWKLDSSGPERLPKIVYVRFLTGAFVSETHTDDIILDERPPKVEQAALSGTAGAASIAKLRSWRLKIKATDTNSGVDRVQVTASKRKPGKLLAYKRKLKVKSAKRPKFVRARDRAGNFSPWRKVK